MNFHLYQYFKVNQNFDFTDRHFIEFGYFNLEEWNYLGLEYFISYLILNQCQIGQVFEKLEKYSKTLRHCWYYHEWITIDQSLLKA